MSRVVITGTATGVKVRVEDCPRCLRQLRLDHCGITADGDEYVDLDAVAFAQNLHLATCRG